VGFRTGPTGLGTSAARPFGPASSESREAARVPTLHCPPAVRDDPALAAVVNERLVAWAGTVGIYPGQEEELRRTDFGDFMMLCHPETDDPDRLVAAGKCALAEWATDDHYCDDESLGSSSPDLGARLGVAATVLDPLSMPAGYAARYEQEVCDDPVLVALQSGFQHLRTYASWDQIGRLHGEILHLFQGYGHEASWRLTGRSPAVWEYLAGRQNNSFRPCIALVDAVAGYELPSAVYAEPRVRRAFTVAGLAATLVNDMYSLARSSRIAAGDHSLPAAIAAEEKCSLQEAMDKTADIHDELVRTFENEAAALAAADPLLRRFFGGVWAWLGGNREWHSRTARYQTSNETPRNDAPRTDTAPNEGAAR
jgi:2-methylisoborneol synthase